MLTISTDYNICSKQLYSLSLSLSTIGSFHLYDTNHDGYITREEMEAIVDSIYKMVGQMVEFSEDEDTPQKRVDKIFDAMDTASCWPIQACYLISLKPYRFKI